MKVARCRTPRRMLPAVRSRGCWSRRSDMCPGDSVRDSSGCGVFQSVEQEGPTTFTASGSAARTDGGAATFGEEPQNGTNAMTRMEHVPRLNPTRPLGEGTDPATGTLRILVRGGWALDCRPQCRRVCPESAERHKSSCRGAARSVLFPLGLEVTTMDAGHIHYWSAIWLGQARYWASSAWFPHSAGAVPEDAGIGSCAPA